MEGHGVGNNTGRIQKKAVKELQHIGRKLIQSCGVCTSVFFIGEIEISAWLHGKNITLQSQTFSERGEKMRTRNPAGYGIETGDIANAQQSEAEYPA
jgi:hypothetical protein